MKSCDQQGVNIQYKQLIQLNIERQPNQKVGRRLKETLFQRRHTDGQQAQKEILIYYRNANQSYRVSPHTSQNDCHQKVYEEYMLERLWRKPCTLLMGLVNWCIHYGRMEVPYETESLQLRAMSYRGIRDLWRSSIRSQREGLITLRFCVIKFYESIKEHRQLLTQTSEGDRKSAPLVSF